MRNKQEFGIAKWFFVISLTAVLGGIVAYFNLRIFGQEDGMPYVLAIVVMGGIAIGVAHYTGSENKMMRTAAFTCDVALFVVLIISAAYSISGLRELSLARQIGEERSTAIKEVGNLKSKQAQLEATRWLAAKDSDNESMQATFKRYERPLFWLMIAEVGLSGLACFLLFGISHLRDDNHDGIPDVVQSKKVARPDQQEFPESLDVKIETGKEPRR